MRILTNNLVVFKSWDGCWGELKFWYYGGSLKNPIFRGTKVYKKPINRENCLTRELGQLADLIGDLVKKKGSSDTSKVCIKCLH